MTNLHSEDKIGSPLKSDWDSDSKIGFLFNIDFDLVTTSIVIEPFYIKIWSFFIESDQKYIHFQLINRFI